MLCRKFIWLTWTLHDRRLHRSCQIRTLDTPDDNVKDDSDGKDDSYGSDGNDNEWNDDIDYILGRRDQDSWAGGGASGGRQQSQIIGGVDDDDYCNDESKLFYSYCFFLINIPSIIVITIKIFIMLISTL